MKASGGRIVVFLAVVPLLALFVGLPLAVILWKGLGAGPGAWFAAVSLPSNRAALTNSLEVGAGVATISLLLGGPLGAALARLPIRGARVAGTLLLLPMAVPSYVWAMAWIALAAPTAGWLNSLAGHNWLNIYGLPGIIFVEGCALFPLVLLPVRAALEGADPSLEEAARISGAGPMRAFLVGSAPVALPAAVSGTLLSFLAAISSFGVPYLLGVAAAKPKLLATTRIYQALSMGSADDVRGAISLCLLLMVFGGAAAWLASKVSHSGTVLSGKGRRMAHLDAPALAAGASAFAWLVTAVVVILPMIAVVLSALTRHYGKPPTFSNLTTDQFAAVLGKRDVQAALAHSGALALCAATAVVGFGAALAFLGRAGKAMRFTRLAEVPYAIPGSVLALAFLLVFSQPVRFILFDRVTVILQVAGTLWMLGIAYVVKYLAFGARASNDAFRAIDPVLEEAARISGAGPGRAFLDVALPLARPALVAAWILAFLPAATELTMSVLLVGPKTQVLGSVLFELASYADPPSAAVLACVVLALAAMADIALRRVAGRWRTA